MVERATRLVRCEAELRYLRSGGDALIAVVEAGNLWNGDDLACSRTLCRAFHWAIFGKREMCSRSMVVVNVGRKNAPEVPLVEDDNVIETFSTDRTDDALGVCILPWGPRWRDDLLNFHK